MRVWLFFILSYSCSLHAQDSTIIIKAGNSFMESVAITDLYQYAQFTYGKVFFKGGDSTNARLNYHRFLEEMQFIDFKSDTLTITHGALIKFIRIKNDVFYYADENGYLTLIKDTNGVKLAEKRTLRMAGRSKIGAYGMSSPSSSNETYSSMITRTNVFNLVPNEDITLTKRTEYYFADKHNQFIMVTKKNLLHQFSKHSKVLSAYLKDNKIDVNKREDVDKLFEFLVSL